MASCPASVKPFDNHAASPLQFIGARRARANSGERGMRLFAIRAECHEARRSAYALCAVKQGQRA